MNKFHIIICFVMSSTFFVEGCDTSENDNIVFFDSVHAAVAQCIENEELFHQQVDVFFAYPENGDTSTTLHSNKEELQKLETTLAALHSASSQSKKHLEELVVQEGGDDLYRSAINVVDAYYSLSLKELVELVRLMHLPPKGEDEEWYKKMDHLLYMLDSKVDERMEIFELEAGEYAKSNNIELFEEE